MNARHLPVILAFLGIAVGFTHAAVTIEPPACQSLDVSNAAKVPNSVLDGLYAAGWTSDPRDGAERLYGPSCPNYATAVELIARQS